MLITFEPRQRAMQFQKHILRHFLGRPALPQNPQRDREDPPLMALNKPRNVPGDVSNGCALDPCTRIYANRGAA